MSEDNINPPDFELDDKPIETVPVVKRDSSKWSTSSDEDEKPEVSNKIVTSPKKPAHNGAPKLLNKVDARLSYPVETYLAATIRNNILDAAVDEEKISAYVEDLVALVKNENDMKVLKGIRANMEMVKEANQHAANIAAMASKFQEMSAHLPSMVKALEDKLNIS